LRHRNKKAWGITPSFLLLVVATSSFSSIYQYIDIIRRAYQNERHTEYWKSHVRCSVRKWR